MHCGHRTVAAARRKGRKERERLPSFLFPINPRTPLDGTFLVKGALVTKTKTSLKK